MKTRKKHFGRYIKIKVIGDGYEVLENHSYYSERFNRWLNLPKGMYSDGATDAPDLPNTDAWLVHDYICRYGEWSDGTKIDNFTASTVLADILWRDGYYFRAPWWWVATYLFGGGAARKNGMSSIRKKK